MEYFFYSRDKADSGPERKALLPDHWAFMDGYDRAMIARGPTVTDDRTAVTGSMHILDLPDDEAAEGFAYGDPLARAGLFDRIDFGLWRNVLGRTMWDFGGSHPDSRFLAIGLADIDRPSADAALQAAYTEFWSAADRTGRCILFGPLLDDDGATWIGSAVLLEAADRTAAAALLDADPLHQAAFYERRDLHCWRFGGRENLQDLVAAP